MLELVVPIDTLEAGTTAELCLRLIGDEGVDPSILRLYDEPITPKRLRKVLRDRKSFFIDGEGVVLRFGTVGNYSHSFVMVNGFRSGAAWTWLRQIAATTSLITARLYDSAYEHWQNAEDPLEYAAVGRSMDGLPMKSNGLPPPLDQMVVDISSNPGRRSLRDGYVEAVGHKMWLGPEFFRRVPDASREDVVSASWLRVTERPDDVLEIVAHDEPFVEDSTADLQDRLRRLLFPATA